MAASVAVHGQAIVEVERWRHIDRRAHRADPKAGAKPMTLQRNAEKAWTVSSSRRSAWPVRRGRSPGSSIVRRASSPTSAREFGTWSRRQRRVDDRSRAARVLVSVVPRAPRRGRHDRLRQDRHASTPGLARGDARRPTRPLHRDGAHRVRCRRRRNQSHPVADALRRHAQMVGALDWSRTRKRKPADRPRPRSAGERSPRQHRQRARMRDAGIDSTGGRDRDSRAWRYAANRVLSAVIDGVLAG